MTVSDWIQVGVGLVAIGASLVALVVAHFDRRTQLAIANGNREHERLALELEYAVRLSANRNQGGSTDSAERARMGAEALALAAVVGERWVPRQWELATNGKSPSEMRAQLDDEESVTPEWVKWKIETALAVRDILAEMRRY